MKSLFLAFFVSLFAHSALAGDVFYIEVEGSINPSSADFILESIQKAASGEALIVRLNTPGGLLTSTRSIIQGIGQSRVPVVVYVSPGGASATSAGALIMLSSHLAAMAPGTNVGAAHPVGSQGEDVKGAMGEKVTNDTAALARAQAALRGRNPEVAEAIVTKSKSYSAEEAAKERVVNFVAASLDELLAKIDGQEVRFGTNETKKISVRGITSSSLRKLEMNTKQKFLHVIADPNISAMLLTLGGVAIYAEVSSGFTLIAPGVVGLFCLLLGFVSMQMLPIRLGGLLIFLLGFALLFAEIFVTSYGLLTVAALACLFLGGLFLMDPSATGSVVSLELLISVVTSVGALIGIVAYLIWKEKRGQATDPLLGKIGTIATSEGLSGTMYVAGELWKFSSTSEIRVGAEARVLGRENMVLKIEERK